MHINEISLRDTEPEKENILDLTDQSTNEDERKVISMVEELKHGQIERNLKDTEKWMKENDEGLLLIQTEINVVSIMRMIINEHETTSSQLGRKSTESGTG